MRNNSVVLGEAERAQYIISYSIRHWAFIISRFMNKILSSLLMHTNSFVLGDVFHADLLGGFQR